MCHLKSKFTFRKTFPIGGVPRRFKPFLCWFSTKGFHMRFPGISFSGCVFLQGFSSVTCSTTITANIYTCWIERWFSFVNCFFGSIFWNIWRLIKSNVIRTATTIQTIFKASRNIFNSGCYSNRYCQFVTTAGVTIVSTVTEAGSVTGLTGDVIRFSGGGRWWEIKILIV